ncbi:CHRD domain-containing protein [Altererythrobacter aerius]|uniref:CHRD domain-containing protein n=1 Tax=Tsuneonella aeria TaxID=1837929 RepID=A0A6I4TG75_9SPHN|nr:CHRD domain-containing protein [Tsuneonella aeria]MXO75664.1 CHRD domain-containing protein [Tsuneonella aeria]
MNRKLTFTLVSLTGAAALAGCATLEEEAVDATSDTYNAMLTGANVVGGGGDPDGSARAEISVSDGFGQVCWEIKDVVGIDAPTSAHIHYGRAGTNGPPVFTLARSNEGNWQGCRDAREWTQNRLQGNPAEFYVQVHNAAYPNGAIRGQLAD